MPKSQTITLTFTADNLKLVGSLHLPDVKNPPFIVGCHGLFANRESPKQISLAQACNRRGIAYLRFDHRGCGQSQGDFNKVTSLPGRSTDLHQAIQAVRRHPATGDLLGLFGSSFGGTVVLAYSAQHAVPSLVTYAAPCSSQSILYTGIPAPHSDRLRDADLSQALVFDLTPQLHQLANLLVVHAMKDEVVPFTQAEHIYRCAQQPKKLIIQPGGDHSMSDPVLQRQFLDDFLAWMQAGAGGSNTD